MEKEGALSQTCFSGLAPGKIDRAPGPGHVRSMRRSLVLAPVVVTLLLVPSAALARQAENPGSRPRVALVLSGGGARGFAHIGVLKVLDELHVPVDVVVGTSVGAVVGGLHATGMRYDDLVEAFRAQDWNALFRDGPDRKEVRLRQKRDDRELTLPFEVGISEKGLRLPTGIIAGAKLTNLLDVLTWPAMVVQDFDSLPIPFRAVATDVATGEAVVLERGRLSTAMRASMAVPAVFAPVSIDGRTLIDGGVVENLPLRVAREMGADVAIVVNLTTGLEDVSEAQTILSISQRVLTIFTMRSTQEQLRTLRAQDVLITPQLQRFSPSSFDRLEDGLRLGEEAARAAADSLRAFAVPAAEYQRIVEERAAGWRDADVFVPDFVRIDTTRTELAPEVILGTTSLRPHEPIATRQLADEATAILGYGGFDRVGIEIREEDGMRGVILRPEDKPWGPGLLRAGLTLFDRQRGDAGWEFVLNYAHLRFDPHGAQVRASIRLGSTQGANVEWYKPLDARERWFAALRTDAVRRDIVLPADTGAGANVEFAELGFSAVAGMRLGTWGQFNAGIVRGILRVERPALPGGGTVERIDVAGFLAQLEIDRLDRIAFPRSGELFLADARVARRFLGGEQSFDRISADAIAFRTISRSTIGLGAFIGTGLGGTLPTTQRFTLGGLFRLTGVQPSAVQGSYAGLGRMIYRYRLSDGDAGIHLGGSVEAGGAWDTLESVHFGDVRLSASAFLGVDTPLGPLHFAYGFTRGVDPGWSLRFGPVF